MSVAQELGISQAEYSEALLLQRVYQLVNQQLKVLCPQCQAGTITHLDHLNTEFYCTRCAATSANKASTKKLGNHKLTTALVEELEIKYLTPTVHRSTLPMTPDIMHPDDEFNVWADWPSNKSVAPRDQRSGGMLSNVDDNFSATDFPGMVGIMRRTECRPSLADAEVKGNFRNTTTTARQPSEPTASELMDLLQLIVENQKNIASSIMRLHRQLENQGNNATQVVPHNASPSEPPFKLQCHASRDNKSSERGVNSSISTTDWPQRRVISRHRNNKSFIPEREIKDEYHAAPASSLLERHGAKIDTRLIKSSLRRSQYMASGEGGGGAKQPQSTQSSALKPDRNKARRNPFRDNPFT